VPQLLGLVGLDDEFRPDAAVVLGVLPAADGTRRRVEQGQGDRQDPLYLAIFAFLGPLFAEAQRILPVAHVGLLMRP
jgi:hypothetical protein